MCLPPQRLGSLRLSALFHHTPPIPPRGEIYGKRANRLSGLCCGQVRPNPASGANGERPFPKKPPVPWGTSGGRGHWSKREAAIAKARSDIAGVIALLMPPGLCVHVCPYPQGYPVGLGLHGIARWSQTSLAARRLVRGIHGVATPHVPGSPCHRYVRRVPLRCRWLPPFIAWTSIMRPHFPRCFIPSRLHGFRRGLTKHENEPSSLGQMRIV